MSSIKQIIINAIVKVSGENPALNREGEASAVEARDDFIRLLMLELFPEESAVVSVPLTEAAVKSPKKTKKTKKEVVPTESPAASPTKATKAKKSKKEVAPAPEPAASPAKSPKEVKAEAKAAKEAEKAAKAAEKEAAKVAKAAAKAATPKKAAKAPEPEPEPVPAPVAESPKKAKATKKVKPAEDANLQKIDPTWRKHLKKADKDGAKESEPLLLAYLNALSKEEFNAKKAEDHVTDFLAGRATPVEDDGKVAAELTTVEFEGKDYYVNPETNRVYEGEGEYDEEVGWTNYKPVGYVGMAKFAEMKL